MFSLRFGSALAYLSERVHENSGLFHGFGEQRSVEGDLTPGSIKYKVIYERALKVMIVNLLLTFILACPIKPAAKIALFISL